MKSLILLALSGAALAQTSTPAPDKCMALSGCKNCLAKEGCQYVPAVGMCASNKHRMPELVWFDASQCPEVEAPFRAQCLTYTSCKDCIDNKCAWGSPATITPTGMNFGNGSCYHSLTCPGPQNTNGGVIVCFDKVESCPAGTASGTAPSAAASHALRPVVRPLPRPIPRPNFGCPTAKPTTGATCPTGPLAPRLCTYDVKCGCLNQSLCVATTEAECKDGIWFVSTNPSKCIQV